MTNNMDNYWINEIESYKYQLHTGPDDKHDLWKWREVLKIGRIMNANKLSSNAMKYQLTMEFETKKPYQEWNISPYTNKDLAVALIKALGINKDSALINNIILRIID